MSDSQDGPVVAQPIKPQADIVFCIDVTGSMAPCLSGVLSKVGTFVESLESAGEVDFRLRLIGYRDLHDPTAAHEPWHIGEFTQSPDEFRKELAEQKAMGGGVAPESTLDALYLAIHSDWRPSRTHKTIVLLTDADSHPTLHPSTYEMPDNDVERVIQDLQTMTHLRLHMVVPKYQIYQKIEQSMVDPDRAIIAAEYQPTDRAHDGLKNIDWEKLLRRLGQQVSKTSVALAEQDEQ